MYEHHMKLKLQCHKKVLLAHTYILCFRNMYGYFCPATAE